MMPLLSQKEVTVVFANVEDLLLVNTVSVSGCRYLHRMLTDPIGICEFLGRSTKGVPVVCR